MKTRFIKDYRYQTRRISCRLSLRRFGNCPIGFVSGREDGRKIDRRASGLRPVSGDNCRGTFVVL